MLVSFLKFAFRNLKRDLYSSTLYVILLVVGISSFAIILTIYNHEMTYDQFLKHSDRTYRATTYFIRGDQEVKWAITNGYLVTLMEENIPEIEQATKFQTMQTSLVLEAGNRKFDIPEKQGFYTDPDFLEVLPYPLKYGDPATALLEPRSIILSEEYAQRFFNRSDVVGEILIMRFSGYEPYPLKVTGVLENVPTNSNLQFNMLVSETPWGGWERYGHPVRGGYMTHVFFRTSQATDTELLNNKIQEQAKRVYLDANGNYNGIQYPVQKLTDIHFNADNLFEPGTPGNLLFARILLTVGCIILIISAINFCILYTAKSLVRAKEIGIRKTLGSSQAAVGFRLIAESSMLSLLCALASIGVAELLLKTIIKSELYDAELSLFDSPVLILSIVISGLALGLVSGLYVTLKSASLNPTQILRGKLKAQKLHFLGTRNLMIVFQFVLTGTLITASLVILKQVGYIEKMDSGYQKEAVITITKPSSLSDDKMEAFKQRLLSESSVLGAGFIFYNLLGTYNAGSVNVLHEGDTISARGQSNFMDPDLLSALNLQIVEGRNFSDEIPGDSTAIIINESAKRQLGLNSVVGKRVHSRREGISPKIIGVIKDYHYQSFLDETPPLIIRKYSRGLRKTNLMIRLTTQNMEDALSRVETEWNEVSDGIPFEPTFLETSFSGLVEKDTQMSKMITTYTVISVVVACFGLIGLVRYTNEQRKKEMGVRKVYGAREKDILKLINSYFGKLILLALFISVPLSIYSIDVWLNSFAYHTSQSILEYLIAGTLLIGLAFGLINFQTISIARSNPIDVLKEE